MCGSVVTLSMRLWERMSFYHLPFSALVCKAEKAFGKNRRFLPSKECIREQQNTRCSKRLSELLLTMIQITSPLGKLLPA